MDSGVDSNLEQKTSEEYTIYSHSTSRIDHLPREVAIDILSRLPITSLLQYKSTSHTGLNLTSDPKLSVMFHNRAKKRNPSILFLSYLGDSNQIYFADGDHDESHIITARKLYTPFPEFNLVGFCNGLLCISQVELTHSVESKTLYVYNPLVGELVPLPKTNLYFNQTEVFGFGFVCKTREYKVVRLIHHILIERSTSNQESGALNVRYLSEIEVLTLGTDQIWRNKGYSEQKFESPDNGVAFNHAFVEGSVHWLGLFSRQFHTRPIIAFNLEAETLQEIPGLVFERQDVPDCRLCEINGCLSLATYYENGQVDVWVMKQYNVKESWTKEFSIKPFISDDISSSRPIFGRVICGLKGTQILMEYGNKSLVMYDPVVGMFQVLQINGLQNGFLAFSFVPSQLSVKATLELYG